MKSYIHLYETNDEFTAAYNGPDYKEPWLSLTEEDMKVNYNKPKLIDFSTEPLTFNIVSAGTINWTASDTAVTKTIDYKLNDNKWASITSNTGASAPTINVNPGDKIQFKGDNAQYNDSSSGGYNSFSGSTALFEAEGNVMSLIYGDNFKNKLTINDYAFAGLFQECVNLISAKNLILPATTLTDSCYGAMFGNCTSLTTAPQLPATTLATQCYYGMFLGCTSLTAAPALPATTLASNCYYYMFGGCTSLTTAPSNLLPATTLADGCYSGMFTNCTSLTTAPALPATTLIDSCYGGMFYNCTSLNYIKCLATDISASNCTGSWVEGVASTGTFVKNPDMVSWTTGVNGIPEGWTVQDA